jgi:hypothetical protein
MGNRMSEKGNLTFGKMIMICKQHNKESFEAKMGAMISVLLLVAFSFSFSFIAAPVATYAAERVYVAPAPTQPHQQKYVQPRVTPQPKQYQYKYKYQYVAPKNWYGQRRSVPNVHEAGKIMGQYYHGRDVRIGPVVERDLFYQAEIRDRRGVLIDKVIIDKRTGRMRSIY